MLFTCPNQEEVSNHFSVIIFRYVKRVHVQGYQCEKIAFFVYVKLLAAEFFCGSCFVKTLAGTNKKLKEYKNFRVSQAVCCNSSFHLNRIGSDSKLLLTLHEVGENANMEFTCTGNCLADNDLVKETNTFSGVHIRSLYDASLRRVFIRVKLMRFLKTPLRDIIPMSEAARIVAKMSLHVFKLGVARVSTTGGKTYVGWPTTTLFRRNSQTAHVGITCNQSRICPLDISSSGSINRNLF